MVAPTRVTLVPHTHWDREWYEPFSVFSERLVGMMDTLLDLTARGFPHFHLDGQTAMIDDYLERRPERSRDVAGAVSAGHLSAGPWVTQMDEFLASGESLIRNLEMGIERARSLGRTLEVGYMPDQFGHIGQMPQILRLVGIDRAMVWRGVPGAIGTSTFHWRSPDGSEVLTESLPLGYSGGSSLLRTEDPESLATAIAAEVERLRPYAPGRRIVVMVGYDHAGPDPTLVSRLERAPIPEDLDVTIGSVASHMQALEASDDLPVWTGELRSGARAHLLPNVYSARAHQKRERGRVEALLERYAEPLAALVPGFRAPEDDLRRVWTLLLWNGAHDSACGCSHDQVAIDVDARFAKARRLASSIAERAMTALGEQVGARGTLRFNPSPFQRDAVPALGYAVVDQVAEPACADVRLERIAGGASVDGVPIRLLDEPDVGDLYTFCSADSSQIAAPPEHVELSTDGFTVRWDGLVVEIRVTRRRGEPFLRLEGVVRNDRPDHRLRLHVGLPFRVARAIAGAPFELVERPLVGEGSNGEAPSPTWPARHVVLAGGIAVFHEGVFEYEIADGREIAVTLLRCVGTISRKRLATRPWPAGPATPTPSAQMLGETRFALGIQAGAKRDALLRSWERFALPLLELPVAGGGALPPLGTLLEVADFDLELSTIRSRDGAVEIRVWNPHADRTTGGTIAGFREAVEPAGIVTLA
jgi:Glycosyl hydrolases family 38 N-terminal domain/Alpha mannosidase middle domain